METDGRSYLPSSGERKEVMVFRAIQGWSWAKMAANEVGEALRIRS